MGRSWGQCDFEALLKLSEQIAKYSSLDGDQLCRRAAKQLAQILLPAAPLVPVVEDAVQRLFAENRLPVLSRCSDAFKQKCVALLTSTRKSTALRSVVNNVISVLMGEMSEAVFASKYASF